MSAQALAPGLSRCFDGYNYFFEHPDQMIEWFDAHMG